MTENVTHEAAQSTAPSTIPSTQTEAVAPEQSSLLGLTAAEKTVTAHEEAIKTAATIPLKDWSYADGVPGTGDAPDYFIPQEFKTIEDQAKAYKDLSAKRAQFSGAPEGAYTFTPMAELKDVKINAEDPLYKTFMVWARDANLSQDGFDKVVNLYLSDQSKTHTVSEDQSKAYHAEQLRILGPEFGEQKKNLASWCKAHLTPDETKLFNGMGDNAPRIKLLLRLVEGQNATPIPMGEAPAEISKSKHEIDLKAAMADPRWRTDLDYTKHWEGEAHKIYQS